MHDANRAEARLGELAFLSVSNAKLTTSKCRVGVKARMKKIFSLIAAAGCAAAAGSAYSQQPCQSCATPQVSVMPAAMPVTTYRLDYQTVYEDRAVTAYRLENETVYEEREVTSYKPVWETQVREKRYMVAKPVYETSEREERYTVQKPVWETQLRDESYDVVRQIPETAEREERYTVQRPVWETSTREERYTVQRPVYETSEREEAYTVMEQQTTYRPVQIDQGQYVTNMAVQPGAVRTRLAWNQPGYVVDPLTGAAAYQRGGLHWTPMQAPATVIPQTTYQPNIVTAQVPQTSLVPRTEVRKVPVQTVRYVNEEMVREVPVQTCRMISEEQVRKVPVTTYRQVVERVEKQTQVQVCKMITEEIVKKVPVTTMKMVQEEKVEQETFRVCRQEQVVQKVQVPHVVEKRVPVQYTQRIPRVIVNKVPLDACGNPIYLAPAAEVRKEPTSTPAAAAPTNSSPSTYGSGSPSSGTPTVAPTLPMDTKVPASTFGPRSETEANKPAVESGVPAK